MKALIRIFLAAFAATLFVSTGTATSLVEGGIDGGGGGTLPSQPAGVIGVTNVIRDHLTDARLVLRYYDLIGLADDYEERLFGGKTTIYDLLNEIEIEIQEEKPCYDKYGNEVDGSIHAETPNTICISAFRIGPKVSVSSARAEVLALVLHELSHYLGLDEIEARDFQGDMQRSFMAFNQTQLENFMESVEHPARKVYRSLDKLSETIEEISGKELYESLASIHFEAIVFQSKKMSPHIPLSIIGKLEAQYLEVMVARLDVAAEEARLISFGEDGSSSTIIQIFEGKSEIPYSKLREQKGIFKNRFDQEPISRMPTKDKLKDFVSSALEYFSDLNSNIYAIRWSNVTSRSPHQYLANYVNPWAQFLGEYAVVSNSCEDRLSLTGINFYLRDNKVVAREIWENGWGEIGAIEEGAFTNYGSGAKLAGGDEFASAHYQVWTPWNLQGYHRNILSMKKVGEEYAFTIDYRSRKSKYSFGDSITESSCEIRLRKTN